MVRIISLLAGLFFTVALVWSFVNGAITTAQEGLPTSVSKQFHKAPRDLQLASDGPFGKFDTQQLQRGFQVYKETCAACHGLKFVAFRNFAALGYNEDEVKALAASFNVPGIDPNTGEATSRPGLPTDQFPSPYANDIAARAANNNAVPPDLSLITKARPNGAAYVYSLLVGYQNAPANLPEDYQPGPGMHYNPYFPNLNIAMAPPLTGEGQVTYAEGNPRPTVDQMAKDVTAFLVWTAEPTLVKRRQTGWPVLGFLLFATILGYMAYRNVWADKKH